MSSNNLSRAEIVDHLDSIEKSLVETVVGFIKSLNDPDDDTGYTALSILFNLGTTSGQLNTLRNSIDN